MNATSSLIMFSIFDYLTLNPKKLKKNDFSFNTGYISKIHYMVF